MRTIKNCLENRQVDFLNSFLVAYFDQMNAMGYGFDFVDGDAFQVGGFAFQVGGVAFQVRGVAF